jgi:hypothetical protein
MAASGPSYILFGGGLTDQFVQDKYCQKSSRTTDIAQKQRNEGSSVHFVFEVSHQAFFNIHGNRIQNDFVETSKVRVANLFRLNCHRFLAWL